jgi:hypothetical protein
MIAEEAEIAEGSHAEIAEGQRSNMALHLSDLCVMNLGALSLLGGRGA